MKSKLVLLMIVGCGLRGMSFEQSLRQDIKNLEEQQMYYESEMKLLRNAQTETGIALKMWATYQTLHLLRRMNQLRSRL